MGVSKERAWGWNTGTANEVRDRRAASVFEMGGWGANGGLESVGITRSTSIPLPHEELVILEPSINWP
jgi:hypothetical protein